MQAVVHCTPNLQGKGLAPTTHRQALRVCDLRASCSRPSPALTPALPANKASLSAPVVETVERTEGTGRRVLLQAGLASVALGCFATAAKAEEEIEYAEAVREISPSQLFTLSQRMDSMPPAQRNSPNSPRLIDVRTPEEYKAGHVPNTTNVSYTNDEEFEARIMPMLKDVDKSAVIVLVCATTKRSIPAVKVLQHGGFRNAMQLAKGMQEYTREGLPVAV